MKGHEVCVQGGCVRALAAVSVSLLAVLVAPACRAATVEPSVFDRLRVGSGVRRPKPPISAAEKSIVQTAAAVPAKRLIPASNRPPEQLAIPLRGTIREYVASVVSFPGRPEPGLTSSGFVPCSRDHDHRCVAVIGDPCRMASSESCEGMYLTVVIDVDRAYALDRAVGGGRYVVENQDDIEDLRAAAP
jgi:hypothetical protein